MKKPTILDVAETAGVAVGTVSRMLNSQPIRKDNRLKIEQAIAELGYKTNTLARAMKTEKTQTVGFLVPAFDEFSSAILSELVRRLRYFGYSVVTFHHSDETDAIVEALDSASSRRIDAVILSGTDQVKSKVEEIIASGLPVLFFNNDIPGIDTDKVLVNDRVGMKTAVGRMLEFGHERIGFVTGDLDTTTGRNRLAGYRDAFKEAGRMVEEDLIYRGTWNQIDGYDAVKQFLLMDTPPTALLSSSYRMTIGMLDCLREHQLTIGTDLDLVSFDDPDMFRLISPGITAIAQPTMHIAKLLCDLVLSRLDGSAPAHMRSVGLDCDLALRGSLRFRRNP